MADKKLQTILGVSLSVGVLAGILYSQTSTGTPKEPQILNIDTVKVTDTAVNVKGKRVLFIGDSHTANSQFGWQIQTCKQTGMVLTNTAVGGKSTPWMVQIAKQYVNRNYDYCFVYGGANDCYNSAAINKTINNLQSIANLCKENNVQCYVLTGFNPLTCVKSNTQYPKIYDSLQRRMITDLKNCTVINCRKAVKITDCWDWLCHMNYNGHKAMADCVIETCKFKRVGK